MSLAQGRTHLATPGPSIIPDKVLEAMHRAAPNIYEGEIIEITESVLKDLTSFAKTSGDAILYVANGHGAWEAAVANLFDPGDTVLVMATGQFGLGWADLCKKMNLNVILVDFGFEKSVDHEKLTTTLKNDPYYKIKGIFTVQTDTASSVLNNIKSIAHTIETCNHPALFLVDSIACFGCDRFEMDEWGVDVAVTGSQKGFMLPAGLAIVGFSDKARAAVETATLLRTFFDIRDMEKGYAADAFPYTPPVGLMNGLKRSIEMIEAEGLENVFARHTRIAKGVRRAVEAWGLELCANAPELYSDSVSAIRTPEGFNATDIVTRADEQYGMAFGFGLGEVAGKVFRIGHLGMLTDAMMLSGLGVAEMVMKDLGLDIKLGSGVCAAQEFYRYGA